MSSVYIQAIPLSTFSTASLTTDYQPINDGLEETCVYITLTNESGNSILISFDGDEDHEVLAANSSKNIPESLTQISFQRMMVMQKGQQIWVKSTTSTAGTVSLSGYYL